MMDFGKQATHRTSPTLLQLDAWVHWPPPPVYNNLAIRHPYVP
jgi:hypothetical protein